jgi:hypothetical protein
MKSRKKSHCMSIQWWYQSHCDARVSKKIFHRDMIYGDALRLNGHSVSYATRSTTITLGIHRRELDKRFASTRRL